MNENIIGINVANWVSVTIMAAVGFFALGLLQKKFAAKQGS